MSVQIEWEGPDLWNILNLPNQELYRLYQAYMDKHSIRRTANKYRKLYNNGEIKMPEREKPYDPKLEPLEIANRRARASKSVGAKALETTTLIVPTEHLPYHEKLQEALDSDGVLTKAVFTSGEHTGYIKNADNEIEYTDALKSARVKFEVDFDSEPKWPLIHRVESVRLPKKEVLKKTDARKAIVLSDLQIPHHDPKAVEVALKMVGNIKPDTIVLVGDFLDLAAWSRFVGEPEWALQGQEAINYAHSLLETLRKLAPTAEIVCLEGNHDARMPKEAKLNSAKSLRLKRADSLDKWPVMSVPYLTAMDNFDIDYISGYPANRYWINDNLQVKHGSRVTSRGSTAKLVADDERVTTIFGHTHRIESHHRTVQTREGGKINAAHSIGCLCKIDGSVPSTKSGFDLDGKAVENYEDWQNAICVVDYQEGDAPFNITPVFINTFDSYRAIYNGVVYEVTP